MDLANFGHSKGVRVALPVSEGLGCSLWGPQLGRHHPASSGHHLSLCPGQCWRWPGLGWHQGGFVVGDTDYNN